MPEFALSHDSEKKSYRVMLESGAGTLVAEVEPDGPRATAYQSEAQLEEAFIAQLEKQAYERLPITCESDLIANLRGQLEKLNNIAFSDDEWDRFFKSCIAKDGDTIVDKTRRIQEDHVQVLVRDDGTSKNIRLIDKANIHNNRLQVINQYETEDGTYANRYDVTVLVNGLPLVHTELKRRGVAIKEAFNQIERYKRDSFWSGCGLFEYVQIFVISNGTHTKYYSNTTRQSHVKEATGKPGRRKTSHSFEFTMWWASLDNKPIQDLMPFTKTFFAKHTILNILTKYCIFTEQELLLVMRPYQIAATERILNRILVSESNQKLLGTTAAGGYIWHTTGSGKTLTSFKTSKIASEMSGVEKVVFVVDRKDLDYQTKKEYDKFEKGAANASASTRVLEKNLDDDSKRIIVTTIQKLASFIKKREHHAIYGKHVVFIFDECHRSQFGEMHRAITKKFKKYHLFGFTGTPIFPENASSGGAPDLKTTKQAFGDQLHTYTIVNAIDDGNVLPFRIDYINTVAMKADGGKGEAYAIDTKAALLDQRRIDEVATYVLDHFDQKTKRNSTYTLDGKRVSGFNSLFAADSIPAAKLYYSTFKRMIEERKSDLKIATIYSFASNEEVGDGFGIEEEGFEPSALDAPSRDFLDAAINDYNAMFGTKWSTDADKFEGYYQDVSERLKNRDLDMVIVVGMFLTGFDATTLNTLWVDKNLRMHGLVQAFSRTNRILNSVKTYGNIVCFRDLEKEVEEAIARFGDKDAAGIVLLRPYHEYLGEYETKLADLRADYPIGAEIVGEKAEKGFIKLFGELLRLRNILTSFDAFEADDKLTPYDLQDYTSVYIDLRDEYTSRAKVEASPINDDIVFEIELVKQVEVNIDYILLLVEKYREKHGLDKEIPVEIDKAISSSPSLRNKRDLIERFINSLTATSDVEGSWQEFIEKKREEELACIIQAENLREDAARAFIEAALETGSIQEGGTEIVSILPPMGRFGSSAKKREEKKERVLDMFKAYLDRFWGI